MKVRFAILITILFIMLISVKSYSFCIPDTLHIKPIFITGKKTTREGAGAIISKIDSTAMIKALTANLSELILQNTPVFIKEYGRGAMATASFRGTAPSHTQVIWNGINLNSPMLGMVDFSTIPVYFIDQVSLLHGSGSLSENSGALGGVIKLQNEPDFMNHFSGRVLSGIASYGSQDEMLRLNMGNQKIQSQTRSFFNHSDNDFSFLNRFIADIDPITGKYNYPVYRNSKAYYRNYGLLQEFYYRPSLTDQISVRYWYQHNDRSLPRLLTNESDIRSNSDRQQENAHRASIEWKNFGAKGSLSISSGLNIQYLNYWFKTRSFDMQDQYAVNSVSRTTSSYNKIIYDHHFKGDFSISTGIDVNIHEVNSTNAPYDREPYGYSKSRNEDDLFLSINKNFGNRIFATLLGRQNYLDDHFTPFIPSFGLEYRTLNGLYVKSNFARNYHEPTLDDLYFAPGGNPELNPEEGITADFGTGYQRIIGNASFKTAVNGYFSRIKNWIIWIPKPYWTPLNMKIVNASGFEFKAELNGKLSALKYQITCNYALTRSVNNDDSQNWGDESYGKQLPYIPIHSANFSVNLSQKGYHLNWIWNYYSKRYTSTTNDELNVVYPYIMNNLNIGKGININRALFNIEFKIFNLFDEEYRSVLQNPMPGRNYSLLVRVDF